MSKPHIHAMSTQRRFGGAWEDYVHIHEFMDCSKGAIADNRHRALTHNTWFIQTIVPRIFGVTLTNSAGRVVSIQDICEQHILEDFNGRYIPSAQDYLGEIEYKDWMNNGRGEVPPSFQKIEKRVQGSKTTRTLSSVLND